MVPDGPKQQAFSFVGEEATPAVAPPKGLEPFADVTDLDALAGQARDCRSCGLRAGCRGVVFGEGDAHARLMLVGEGPGAVEDELGRPFVGPAGQLLDRILAAIGLARGEVYITNVVKCRPPENRLPGPLEVDACRPWLAAQLRIIAPTIVICLGALATQTLLDRDARITKLRGTWQERDGVLIMPTFHPAAVLRDPDKKRPVWEDFKRVREALKEF